MLTRLHFEHGQMDPSTSVQKQRRELSALSGKESAAFVRNCTCRMFTLVPRFRAILPRQMVVLVRIPGCSSFDVLARYLSKSPFTVRSDNFVMTIKTALTVCSRTRGATSVKPEI